MKTPKTRAALIAGTLSVAFAAGLLVDRTSADQPYMRSALDQLRGARATLAAGEPDKGGHRVAAMHDIDAAIGEVRAGIAYAGY